ncbi:MAG TPA: alpha/beta hydrolase [Deltaproteobacteria bacterium]|nr:alpha/beta hydrolase [Deltaproteobacteria bacterium]
MNIETYGRGIPIVFIHGAGGSTLSWLAQKAYFEKTNLTVLIDLPGHGRSDGKSSGSIEAYARAVKRTLEDNGIGPAYIAGHSMGGAVAMQMAISYPGLLKGLILIGTGARLKVYPEILEGVLEDKEKTARMIVDTAFSASIPAALKERVFAEYMKNDARTIFDDFTACDSFNLMGSLEAIRVPTLVICGADDRFTPPKYSRYLAETIPGARLALVEGTGHMVMIEKPGQVNKAIEGFLAASMTDDE